MKHFIAVLCAVMSIGQCAYTQLPLSHSSVLKEKIKSKEESKKGPAWQRKFFEDLYYPGNGPTPAQRVAMKQAWETIPKDPGHKKRAGGWTFIGPDFTRNWGQPGPQQDTINRKWTGRITGVEFTDVLRVSAANGGLFESKLIGLIPIWVPIGDSIPSLSIGAFASNPVNPKTILVGTGEYATQLYNTPSNSNTAAYGTEGIWITNDGGQSWRKPIVNPSADNIPFEEIYFYPGDTNWVFAVSTSGVYWSNNGGNDFQAIPLPSVASIPTDMALSSDGQHAVIAYVGGSTTACAYYPNTILSSPQLLTNDFLVLGKSPNGIKMSYAPSSPQTIYANCTYAALPGSPTVDTFALVFKSTQYGAPGTWIRCNAFYPNQQPALNYNFGNQGFRDNVIKVSPLDPNVVVMGAGTLFYCNDGINFYETDGWHADQASLNWKPDGTRVFLGNDGGFLFSENNGQNWKDDLNYLPVTQVYTLDVAPDNPNKMICGTQDNGILRYNGSGQYWEYVNGGDGGDALFHPFNYDTLYATIGGMDYVRSRSFTGGAENTWSNCETGISHMRGQFGSPLATDRFLSNYLYTAHDTVAYYSTNQGNNWIPLVGAGLTSPIRDIAVGSGGNPHVYFVYAASNTFQSLRMDVDGSPYSLNFIADPGTSGRLRSFWAEVPYPDVVYAASTGPSTFNNRVFRSINAGDTWTNISGDLPTSLPPITDLWVNPADTQNIVISTEFGCLRSLNGGNTWTRWDMGMPNRSMITDMDYCVDNGKMYVYASSFGRGIWRREASDMDWPVDVPHVTEQPNFSMTCFPNPVENELTVSITGDIESGSTLFIRDLMGTVLRKITPRQSNVSRQNLQVNVSDLPSGVYFCEWRGQRNHQMVKVLKIK